MNYNFAVALLDIEKPGGAGYVDIPAELGFL
jgi:hypothetical protein